MKNGHAEYESEEPNEETRITVGESTGFTASTKIVQTLLQAGAHVNDTSSGLNPASAHLMPTQVKKPNVHILKMLMVAGEDSSQTSEEFIPEKYSLQNLVRKCIREHLSQIHPETNLYFTTSKLGLPRRLQTYLLFYNKQENDQILKDGENKLLSKASDGDVGNVLKAVKAGVDVNGQGDKDMTALMIASQAGHLELLEELIKAGADHSKPAWKYCLDICHNQQTK